MPMGILPLKYTPADKNKALFIEGFFMPARNIILDSLIPLDRAGIPRIGFVREVLNQTQAPNRDPVVILK